MAANIQQPIAQQQPRDEWVFLAGRPPMGEYLGFVQQNAADEAAVNLQTLADEWRKANSHILQLERDEAGIANNPTISPLPDDLKPLAEQLQNAPLFKR